MADLRRAVAIPLGPAGRRAEPEAALASCSTRCPCRRRLAAGPAERRSGAAADAVAAGRRSAPRRRTRDLTEPDAAAVPGRGRPGAQAVAANASFPGLPRVAQAASRRRPPLGVADLAAEVGYADHAHLARRVPATDRPHPARAAPRRRGPVRLRARPRGVIPDPSWPGAEECPGGLTRVSFKPTSRRALSVGCHGLWIDLRADLRGELITRRLARLRRGAAAALARFRDVRPRLISGVPRSATWSARSSSRTTPVSTSCPAAAGTASPAAQRPRAWSSTWAAERDRGRPRRDQRRSAPGLGSSRSTTAGRARPSHSRPGAVPPSASPACAGRWAGPARPRVRADL